jgi:hypothetical protein
LSEENGPGLVQRINSILAGLNIFLLAGFFVLWGLLRAANVVLARFQLGAIQFWFCAAIALVVAVFAGIWGGRRLYGYFRSIGMVGSYAWLIVLAYLSVTTFAAQFGYGI